MDTFSLYEAQATEALPAAAPGLPFSYYARRLALHHHDAPVYLRSSLPAAPPALSHDSPVDADWQGLVDLVLHSAAPPPSIPDDDNNILEWRVRSDDTGGSGGGGVASLPLPPGTAADGMPEDVDDWIAQLLPVDLRTELVADDFVAPIDVAVAAAAAADLHRSMGDPAPDYTNGSATGPPTVSYEGIDTYSKDWLINRCETHLYELVRRGIEPGMTSAMLADLVHKPLISSDPSAQVSATLYELLGDTAMELIPELVAHREEIQREHGAARKAAKRSQLEDWKTERELALLRGPSAMPTGGIVDRSLPGHDLPHVYRTGTAAQLARLSFGVSLFGAKYSLPAGTQHFNEKDYEEYILPAAKQSEPLSENQVITIDKMPKWTHACYPGYKSLNKVQSLVHPIAFETNENLLVCAPTGAGKTDVAMLTVLRCVSNYIQAPAPEEDEQPEPAAAAAADGSQESRYQTPGGRPNKPKYRPPPRIAKKDFKIIYVAPMKALAAEIVEKFSKRLAPLGLLVRELTGDMQMTKQEILATQMIVTTPEKWDVITRKTTGDSELSMKVKLLIIDEVHLLNEDRGTVLETIVARTQRQVETSQSLIRIVGLSATLPNFLDVAEFLRVNPRRGLFFFDNGFRPVPLTQHMIGIKGKTNSHSQRSALNRVCYEKALDNLKAGFQVMVFVHSRKDTYRAAEAIRELAIEEDMIGHFDCTGLDGIAGWSREVGKSRNVQLKELFQWGSGMHHAGMLRADRTLTEKLFSAGAIKILFCTATLAWGVNLPAHAVIIRGTDVYDAQKGSFVDVGILDVLQIFGRAGRPQFESEGVGYILTPFEKLSHYMGQLTQQHPIESQFASQLVDNLNAEVALGTVASVEEAVQWLGYTYMSVRMRKNPQRYGVSLEDDPALVMKRRELVEEAARTLFFNNMVVYDQTTGMLASKDIGRIASTFYVKYPTIELINQWLTKYPHMAEADVLALVSECHEFKQIKLRAEEHKELLDLLRTMCPCQVKDTSIGESHTKVNVLLQSYISNARPKDFALVSDTFYIAQNAARILRAIFELCVNRGHMASANSVLGLCKSVERKMWPFVHPLAQFSVIPFDISEKLSHLSYSTVTELRELSSGDIGELIRYQRFGDTVSTCAWQFPWLDITSRVAPITSTVIELHLDVACDFDWLDVVHGNMQVFHVWIEDGSGEVYHTEQIMIQRNKHREPLLMAIKLPIASPPPSQLFVQWVSDTWLGSEGTETVTLDHVILPDLYTPHTDLLPLNPLPVSALQNPALEAICSVKFQYFNPIQTQVFHTLYHTRENVLLGAPTGSGKTVAAELAMWATLRDYPKSKIVYIAPLKALVRERVDDWRVKLAPLGVKIVELTGDVAPDMNTITQGDIIITTPEKWDGVSRNWRSRSYVQAVRCVIIDEIHLLGGDRGPILEIIVSRMHYIAESTKQPIRIVGLSTALANARDLADWLGISPRGLFNFRHSVRPVQLETMIDGFAGKHYCPRMATMNRPCYANILQHSRQKPALVFVSSRRQTRLTALDLISYCCLDDSPKRFLHMKEDDNELERILERVKDTHLQHTLAFGIGMHHAGLTDSDRRIVEELFVSLKIQVLVATSTLAWGVNTPAHLVCIKGTEFYDAKKKKYVDMAITDVLQMMGRAGRPGYDDKGVACVFVEESKKNYYKKFLHSPFPVESSLHNFLHDHLNAEISTGTITSKQDALDFLTWTYFFRRLTKNPTYYDLASAEQQDVSLYLSRMLDQVLQDLDRAGCIELDGVKVIPTRLGAIASYYYMFYQTLDHFHWRIRPGPNVATPKALIETLCLAQEYAELPVRHNEDLLNKQLAQSVPLPVSHLPGWDNPHLKTHLLLQAHLSHAHLPITDYVTDGTMVLDQSVRVLQAMLDVAVHKGLPDTCVQIIALLQCIKQAQWLTDDNLQQLPKGIAAPRGVRCIAQLFDCSEAQLADQPKLLKYVANLPLVRVQWRETSRTSSKSAAVPEGQGDKSGATSVLEKQLVVGVTRVSSLPAHRSNRDTRIHAPRFPKAQYEGWYLLAVGPSSGSDDENAVHPVELRRFQFRERERMSLNIATYGPGTKLYVMCDGYLGLDQEFVI